MREQRESMDWDDFADRAQDELELQRSLEALAHPIRRFVIGLLQVGGAYAGDLAASVSANFGISAARASQHLSVLARARLVSVVPEGNMRYYSLAEGSAEHLADWLSATALSARAADR